MVREAHKYHLLHLYSVLSCHLFLVGYFCRCCTKFTKRQREVIEVGFIRKILLGWLLKACKAHMDLSTLDSVDNLPEVINMTLKEHERQRPHNGCHGQFGEFRQREDTARTDTRR